MSGQRVCAIYDDRDRPETTGGYCLRALREFVHTTHVRPDRTDALSPTDFDLFVRVDDGIEFPLPAALRPLAWWAIDTHLDPDRCLVQARTADLTFAAQKAGAEALRRAGVANAAWLPLACDPAVHRPHDIPHEYDVCFVGNPFPGPRAELVELLRRHFPSHFVGRAYFDDMARAYSASRAAFNRSIRDDLNMRVFEALACGPLLVTNALPPEVGQDELFRDGVHLATYRDADELLDKLRFYLARPRTLAKVARAGREEAVARHTYRHRMEELLRSAERLPRAVPTSAPSPVGPGASAPRSPAFDPGYFEFDRPELVALVPVTARDVVDVGCGAGRLGAALRIRQGCRVVGIEADPAAAAAARTRLDLVVEGDVESLDWPFPPHSFDAAVCGDVLEHLRDPLAFLRRARTWLRPDGVLVASLPNVRHHSVVRGLLAGDWTYEPAGLLDRTHLRFFTRREVEKLLFRAGFEVPRLTPVPGPGYAEWEAAGRPGEVSVGGLRIGPIEPAEAEEFYTYQWLAATRPAAGRAYDLTSIVILTHNQLPLTRACLDSIRLLTDEPYELVLVDNGSTDGTPEYFRALAASDERVSAVLNPVNRGFPAGCNQGLTAARGAQVLLLNNDTIVTTGWLTRLLRALHAAPDVGLAGPCSNRVSGEQQIRVTYSEGDLSGLDGFAWEHGRRHDDSTEPTDRLVGFCLLVKRAVIDAIGLLDERFGVGNFEDDDYCRRAAQAGFRAVIARDCFVHHVGGATFRAADVDYDALLRQNAEKFRAKWGARERGAGPEPVAPAASRTGGATDRPFAVRPAALGGLLLVPATHAVALSGCLIVRDNARTIRACLESLRPWVDELVVVDTGSKDDTPRIAAELGARVFRFPWIDDFSAARNESVRHARGAWVFWMDSDDVIDPANGRALRDLALGPHPDDVLGYVVRVHCTGPDPSSTDDVTVVDHVKLFRNRPELRFEHRIHEQIIPAIRRAGGRVAWTELFVVHAGYDHSPAGQAHKKDRDLRILHRELAEMPGHPFTLFNLGMTYADMGEPERAASYLEESLRNSAPGDSQRRKAYALLAFCRAACDDLPGALSACAEGLAECPEDVELRFRHGVYLHTSGRLREAVAAYESVLSARGERYFTSLDRGIAGFKARANLAAVHADLGEWDRAERLLRAVTAEEPNYRPGWQGLGDLFVRRGRLDEAAAVAARLTATPRLAAEGHLLAGRVALARGAPAEARRAWEAAVALGPKDVELLERLARLGFEANLDGTAERALRALTAAAPGDAAAHHNLGSILLRTNRPAEAIGAFRRSLELRPGSVETRVCLGYALRAAGDRAGAAAAWRAVLVADPGHREAADALRELGLPA